MKRDVPIRAAVRSGLSPIAIFCFESKKTLFSYSGIYETRLRFSDIRITGLSDE